MHIQVSTRSNHPSSFADGNDGTIDFPDAKTWVIDDEERLHIVKEGGGNIASFNRGHWSSVREITATPNPNAGPFATQ